MLSVKFVARHPKLRVEYFTVGMTRLEGGAGGAIDLTGFGLLVPSCFGFDSFDSSILVRSFGLHWINKIQYQRQQY